MRCGLILGGARSGKSAYAEAQATASGKAVLYIATAQAGDGEMAARIAHHRQQRPSHWITREEPLALGAAIAQASRPGQVVLVDCLTLWLSNLLFSQQQTFPDTGLIALPERFHQEQAALLSALDARQDDVWLVSNELGMGIVPMGAVSRTFADEAGRLNQAIARQASEVVMLIAGLPLWLKNDKKNPGAL
jgi:adenosylcobinamide kinase/adenosylcobinamide-phosphate guanylyltransferase